MTIDRTEKRLRAAIDKHPEAPISIFAPEPIATLFKQYVEAIRTNTIELDRLQTHMDDAIKALDEDTAP